MESLFTEKNYDDNDIYYQIDIHMSENTRKNAERIAEIICRYCDLPLGYNSKKVNARILLSYEQGKTITIDCGENFEICDCIFHELNNFCPLFIRDNFYKRKGDPTYTLRKGDD